MIFAIFLDLDVVATLSLSLIFIIEDRSRVTISTVDNTLLLQWYKYPPRLGLPRSRGGSGSIGTYYGPPVAI